MPSWKKVVASGSDASFSSLTVDTYVSASSFKGSFTGSLEGTASQAISSSYALTASYALFAANGGGGGISAIYIANAGITQGTASYFDFTGAGVTATVSNNTASINVTGGGGGGTNSGQTTNFTQSVAATTWTFLHNLNTRTPLVQVYDTSYNQIVPQYISSSNANTILINFGIATAGYAVASTGGTIIVTGSNVILNQTSPATTWSFEHNLNYQYPVFQIYGSTDEVIIPQRIVATDLTSSLIYFPSPVSGKAVATVGGFSGSSGAGVGFPFSGSAVITGSFMVSQSFVDFSNASYVTGSFTGSLYGSASFATSASFAATASFANFATSASYSYTASSAISSSLAQTASYVLNAISASQAATASSANTFVVRNDITASNALITGTITAQTLIVQTVTSSIVYSSGSNLFGSALTDTQTFTGSVNITGSSVNLKDGAFSGSGANLFAIPATAITGLNLSQISSGSVSASISPNFGLLINTSVSASNFTGSFTGSLAGIATSASFAYTASSAVNASASLTSISSSYALSASYAYTASSAISSSFATFAYSASFAPGFSVSMSQATPALTWSFTHNLNSRNPVVQVYDTTYAQIIPNQIVGMDNSTAEIRFDYAQAGYAVFSNGGGLYVTGSTSTLVQTVGATTWSFTHNLNNKYNTYEVYDDNDYVLIPSAIKAIDTNSAELYFSGLQTGRAVAQFSGINGAPNATTASYAVSASFATNAASASYLNPITNSYVVLTQVSQSLNYVDDVAAAAGGVPLGGIYRNGNFILIRLS
jgi:hypothetical protein